MKRGEETERERKRWGKQRGAVRWLLFKQGASKHKRQGSSAPAQPAKPGWSRTSVPGQYGHAARHAGTRLRAQSLALQSQLPAQPSSAPGTAT
ncbi:hypothetical protein NQZ68_013332 [Dissostichus eleginoides]|nr:hypothetical protein NQZ68_013332 [Dissostichus eleginoides]